MSPRIRSFGPSSSSTGLTEPTADLIYLRLDASNDPLTDQLSITGGGVDIDHVQTDTGDSEKYDVTMSSAENPGSAAFYGSWLDATGLNPVSDYDDTWGATIHGTRVGATGATMRVGVIAGIDMAADLEGHFLPRHADIGGVIPKYDLGGPTTGDGVFHQWRDLYLYGDILSEGAAQSSQGTLAEPFLATYFTQSLANTAGPRTDLPGIRLLSDTDGDLFVGSDPQYPSFYVQKATKANSSALDNTEDASNLYQGSWGPFPTPNWPFIEAQFGAGDGSVGAYTTMGEDDTTYIRDGAFTIGAFIDPGGGGGLVLADRSTQKRGVYFHFDETGGPSGSGEFLLRTMSSGAIKATQRLDTISFAGTRLTEVRPKTDAVVDLGDATHQWKDIYISGSVVGGSAGGGDSYLEWAGL